MSGKVLRMCFYCVFKVNDELLQDLSYGLGQDWYNLGLHLNVNSRHLTRIINDGSVHVTERPIRMLDRWRATRKQEKGEIPELCKALAKVSRNDLVQMVREKNDEKGTLSAMFIKDLSDHLTKIWYTLGVYLGVPTAQLDVIEESTLPQNTEPAGFRLLKLWKGSTTLSNKSALDQLLKGLETIKRNDLVRQLKKRVEDNDLTKALEETAMASYYEKGKGPEKDDPAAEKGNFKSQSELLTEAAVKKAASDSGKSERILGSGSGQRSPSAPLSFELVEPPSSSYQDPRSYQPPTGGSTGSYSYPAYNPGHLSSSARREKSPVRPAPYNAPSAERSQGLPATKSRSLSESENEAQRQDQSQARGSSAQYFRQLSDPSSPTGTHPQMTSSIVTSGSVISPTGDEGVFIPPNFQPSAPSLSGLETGTSSNSSDYELVTSETSYSGPSFNTHRS